MYQLDVPVIVNGNEDISRETIYSVYDFHFPISRRCANAANAEERKILSFIMTWKWRLILRQPHWKN